VVAFLGSVPFGSDYQNLGCFWPIDFGGSLVSS
jgi:hypothetical protein